VEEVVRSTVEETLNGLLEQEADQLCGASRYERSAERVDTRAGHYTRRLLTKAGEVRVQTGADGDRHLFLRNTSQSPPDRERRDGRSGWFGANTG
jgi:transposase-like protein